MLCSSLLCDIVMNIIVIQVLFYYYWVYVGVAAIPSLQAQDKHRHRNSFNENLLKPEASLQRCTSWKYTSMNLNGDMYKKWYILTLICIKIDICTKICQKHKNLCKSIQKIFNSENLWFLLSSIRFLLEIDRMCFFKFRPKPKVGRNYKPDFGRNRNSCRNEVLPFGRNRNRKIKADISSVSQNVKVTQISSITCFKMLRNFSN